MTTRLPSDRTFPATRPAWPRSGGCALVMALLAAASTARGQAAPDVFLNQQRLIEEEIRSEYDELLPPDRRTDFDVGGWFSYYYSNFNDGLQDSRILQTQDFRLYGSLSLDEGAHQAYARLRLQHFGWSSGDSFDGDDNYWAEPLLDRAFYQFDLQRAMQAYAKQRIDWNFRVKVGRDFVDFGTGYALSVPMDQVLMTADVGPFEITGLLGKANWFLPNLDPSHPNYTHTDRCFYGTQVRYTGLERHRPFMYAYYQDDQLGDKAWTIDQDWDYDSAYFGLGSEGELIRDLRYGTEWVLECGKTYGNEQTRHRDDVQAWAFDIDLQYVTRLKTRPMFSGEYMFASGDADRLMSATDSVGGNTVGDDNAFNAFGYRNTGLAFAPRLSNVHIWRMGGSFLPLERVELLRTLELGTNWYLYWKNKSNGPISDVTADEQDGYLGWEMDYYLNWRLTSDLSWTTRFGTFFPGDAFSDQSCRTFVLMGVTWSF